MFSPTKVPTREMPIKIRVCPLCGTANLKRLLTNRGDKFFQQTLAHKYDCIRFDICACGFVMQNPRPSLEEIGCYGDGAYQNHGLRLDPEKYVLDSLGNSFHQALADWTDIRLVEAEELGMVAAWLDTSRDGPKASIRVLDIGADSGALLQAFRQHGYSVAGVEPDGALVEVLRDKCQLDVRHGYFNSVTAAPGEWDVIVASHVLEHVPDIDSFLEECWCHLRPGGYLVIAVPNVLQPWKLPQRASLWGVKHLWGFTPYTLSYWLNRNAFDIQDWVNAPKGIFCFARRLNHHVCSVRDTKVRMAQLIIRSSIALEPALLAVQRTKARLLRMAARMKRSVVR